MNLSKLPRTMLLVGLSIYIVYHLTAIIILPNSESVLGRWLSPYLTVYANNLGLNASWRFYSPDPVPYLYFEYEPMYEADVEREFETLHWPPRNRDEFLHDNYLRLTCHSQSSSVTADLSKRFLVPWLCRRHPDAYAISVRPIWEEVPTIERAGIEQRDFAHMVETRSMAPEQYECANEESAAGGEI